MLDRFRTNGLSLASGRNEAKDDAVAGRNNRYRRSAFGASCWDARPHQKNHLSDEFQQGQQQRFSPLTHQLRCEGDRLDNAQQRKKLR